MWGRESPSPREGHGPKMGMALGTYWQTLTDIRAKLRVEEDISIHRGGKEVKGQQTGYLHINVQYFVCIQYIHIYIHILALYPGSQPAQN